MACLRRIIAVSCLAVAVLAASEHHGQVTFGTLPVPGATVTVTQGDKKFVAITDPKGAYSFPDLADGAWKIQVEMLCFSTINADVIIAPGAPDAIWELKLLPFAEIQAAAGPRQPTTSEKPLSISTAPPPTRPDQPAETQTTKPSSKSKSAKAAALAPPPNPQAGFQRADLNASSDTSKLSNDAAEPNQCAADGLLVNGSVNNGAASPFAQSPAFGNNRRGGRSLYNGNIGITLDNAALDARSFSLTGQDTPKPGVNRLNGFASFGGPLYIPHILKPSRTPIMFFVGYQWMRNRNASTVPALMPTFAQRSGDFSQALNPLGIPISLVDPTSGAPFAGNIIPQSRISRQAQSLLNLYPQPNFNSSTRYNYQIPIVGRAASDSVMTNLQKTFNMKDQLSGNFGYQRTSAENPNVFGFTDTTDTAGFQATINFSHRFTTHLFDRFSYQYSRYSSRLTPYFANKQNVSGDAGITGNDQSPLYWGPPSLSFSSGINGLSDGQESFIRNQTGALSYNSYWNHRNHNVTFGADWKKLQFNALSQQNPRGTFTFTGAATQTPGAQLGTGSDFADFLLGIPDTSSIAYGNADKYFRSSSYDAFFTDDWRISSGLTVNVGGRWEYNSPITEKYGRLVNLDIAPGFTAVAPVVANSPTGTLTGGSYPDSLVQARQARLSAANRYRVASVPRLFAPRSSRIRRLLQHLGLPDHREPDGPAGAALQELERAEHRQQRAHPRQRLQRLSHDYRQHLCHRSKFPHRLRAKLECPDPA